MIFGGTEFRVGISGAKFDLESDFEVCLVVAPRKPTVPGPQKKTQKNSDFSKVS